MTDVCICMLILALKMVVKILIIPRTILNIPALFDVVFYYILFFQYVIVRQ